MPAPTPSPPSPPPPSPMTGTDVLTYKYDLSRSGLNPTESLLTPANVAPATFGLLRVLSVDGKVDAQPLYVSKLAVAGESHNVVIVATEHDSVYAFDSDTGASLWKVSLLGSGETLSDTHGCGQVTPEIGITSTPVKISATFSTAGGGTTTFSPGQYEERAALLLTNGTIVTSWTSHCDIPPYSGWIIAFAENSLARTAILNVGPNGDTGPAIWMSGGGPAADSAGNIYLLTANGTFETTLDAGGFPQHGDFGNSFLKVAMTGGTLTVADYFTMSNEVAESAADRDLGSGGALLLPDLKDAAGAVRHLVIGAGKDGNIYVVDRDSMGKFSAAANAIWQQLNGALPGGIWSTPAYFDGSVYYGDANSTLKAFSITNAKLSSVPQSQSPSHFMFPGTAPSVSANGTANGIVWAHENSNPAVLHAYDAANLATEIYNSSQAAGGRDQFGPGNKFITPIVADGKVFVGGTGGVAVFGLLH